MIKNYFKIAWRNLVKHKLYSVIKIGGFAFSIAACMLISLYIIHETSYDRSYPDSDRLYRAVGQFSVDGSIIQGIAFEAPLAATMKADLPEIEQAGRLLPNPLFGAGSNQVSTDDRPESLHEEGIVFIDQELLNMLQPPMVHGDRQRALSEPNAVVLTATKARKYFAGDNPINKVLYFNNDKSKPYTVRGVVADIPTNSHLYGYDFFLNLAQYDGDRTNWLASNYVTYFKIRSGTNIPLLAEKITKNVLENYKFPAMRANGRQIPAFLETARINLQPLPSIHLHSYDIRDYHDAGTKGDIRLVWLFGGIAGFILLIACINFINLSTAKSASRAKEVGLRKVAGSYRRSLVVQFLVESMLYSLLSIGLGILLAWLLLPLFNQLAGKQLIFPWTNLWLLPAILLSAIGIGLLAGFYPAAYLSGFKPISALKGQLSRSAGSPLLRNGLVVFQFTTSIVLIIGTLIINNQLHFILNRKIGFDKDLVMVIQATHTLGDRIATLKEEIGNIPGVQHVSVSDYLPVRMDGTKRNGNSFWKAGRINEDPSVGGQIWIVDEDYIPTLGIQLRAGRNFKRDLSIDSESAIINQSLAESLQLDNPIGARLTNGGRNLTVIGVVEDFNFESMKDEVNGLCMVLGSSPGMMAVKITGKDLPATIDAVAAQWKKFSPEQTIRFTFLDEGFANMYAGVQRTGTIFTCFSVLAIVVACLGLFGLAAFTAEQRTKEIGIRKILGASVAGIVRMLSSDFVKPVLISIVIASPVAWWAMSKWLEDFAYRTDIRWWMFALAGLAAVLIALLTVSWQAIRAALANPVKSLRTE